MSKKLLGICTAVVLIAGLITAIAIPAAANHTGNTPPPAGFLPDDDDTDTSNSDVLSDRFDGTDQLAHLTLVAPQQADRAEFYVCPAGFAGGDFIAQQAELAQCTLIGTDSTGVAPTTGGAFTGADEAYDVTWDIPTPLDTAIRDILMLACAGAGSDIEPPGQNCVQTNQRAIRLDDAAGGTTGQTTAAEITRICTLTTAECAAGVTAQGTPERAAIDARFRAFRHGDPVPNDGFVFRVTSSADLPADDLQADIDFGADASNDPQILDAFDACLIIETFADRLTWECAFTDGQITDDSEFALWVEDGTAGEGFCLADGPSVVDPGGFVAPDTPRDCTLDSHYHASTARVPTATVASFREGPAAEGTPPPGSGCEQNETPDKDETNPVATGTETIEVCFRDQFGGVFAGKPVTFESTGPTGSRVASCAAGGFTHDHNNDGQPEHCHATTNASGIATAVISQVSSGPNPARPGDQVVVACSDPEQDGGLAPTAQPANHGCATTTAGAATPAGARDQVVKHWISRPVHIHLVFQGTGSAADPCHTGDTFRENVIGDRDTLVACVFDGADNPATTNQPGPTGANPGWRLQWFAGPVGGGELTATRFASVPPGQTGADGRAIAELESFRQGNDTITVTLFNTATGANVAAASINKRVTQVTQPTSTQTGTGQPTGSPGPGDRTLSLEASKNRKTFGRDISLTATISGTTAPGCVAGQTVTLSRTIAGTTQAVQVATGTTDSTGTVSFTRTADQSATWVASTPAAGNCSAATSDGAVVQVRKLVTLKFQPGSTVRRGTRITAIITVAPCAGHEGDKITFWKAIQGVLSKIGDKRSDNNCAARFRRTVRKDSVFQGRSPKSDDDHIGGKSRRKGVNVR